MKLFFSLGALASGNMLLWFGFQWYLISQLGAGAMTDAFFAAVTVPQLVLMVVTGSLTNVLIPYFSGETAARIARDTWRLAILVGGLFSLIAALLAITASWWVSVAFPGLDDATSAICAELTRIQLAAMVLIAVNGVFTASFNARKQFLLAELAPLLGTLIGLVLMVLTLKNYGVEAASWASLIRVALQTLILLPGIGALGGWDFGFSAYRAIWAKLQPLLLGSLYFKTDQLLDRYLSSFSAAGSLSLYYFAQQAYAAANQILAKAINTPMIPALSKLAKNQEWYPYRAIYRKKLIQMIGVTVFGFVVLLLGGKWILQLLAGHGAVSQENIDTLWWVMVALVGQLVGGNIGLVVNSAAYARGDTKTPTTIMSLAYTIGIVLKIAGFWMFGLIGLALATSIYYSIYPIVMWFKQERFIRQQILSGRVVAL